jgi:hypothetical protein
MAACTVDGFVVMGGVWMEWSELANLATKAAPDTRKPACSQAGFGLTRCIKPGRRKKANRVNGWLFWGGYIKPWAC